MQKQENTNDIVITEENFSQYFRDVRTSKPERGDVIARFAAVAELIDGRMKQDLIGLLKNTDKAIPATNVMRKLGGATEYEASRVCREMCQDLLAGLTDEEVERKAYQYEYEAFYYAKKDDVPVSKNWSIITIQNLEEFLDREGNKLEMKWKFVEKNDEKSVGEKLDTCENVHESNGAQESECLT